MEEIKKMIWCTDILRSVNLSDKEKVILLLIDMNKKIDLDDLNNINTLEILISKKIINSKYEIDYNEIV